MRRIRLCLFLLAASGGASATLAAEPAAPSELFPPHSAPGALDRGKPGRGAAPSELFPPHSAPELLSARPEQLSLRHAIQLALLNNRSLEKAGLDRETQRFDLRVAQDEFVPNLHVGSSVGYNPVTANDVRSTARTGDFYAEVSQRLPTGGRVAVVWENDVRETSPGGSGADYAGGFALRYDQPLLRGGGLASNLASLRIARLTEESNVLGFRQGVIDTITRVVFAYRALLAAKLQLEVTENALQRARDQLRVNRALVEAGILPPVEIIQTEADIASQEFNLLTARTALESAHFTLIRLLDIDRRTPLDPSDPIVLPEFGLGLEEARRLAYANRSDYLQAEHALQMARHGVDASKNNLLWDLSLSSRYRLEGRNGSLGSAVDRTFSRDDENWFVGLNLNIPVGDFTRRQSHMRARSRLLKVAIDLAEVRDNVEIELQDAFRMIELGRQRVRVAAVARELAERKLEIEKGKLQTGRTTNFAIVTFQNDLLRVRLAEISAQISYLNSLSSLDQTLGITLATWGVRIDELAAGGPTRTSLEGAPPGSSTSP